MTQRTFHPCRWPLGCFVPAVAVSLVLAAAAPTNRSAAAETTGAAETVEADPVGPSELSVAPLSHVEYPSDRPAWLDATPQLDPTTETWTVASGPSETSDQSVERLRVMTRAAIASYAKRLTGAPDAEFLSVSDTWIDEELVQDRYAGTLTRGDTTLHESAVRLRFSPDVQDQVLTAWQETRLRGRLVVVATAVIAGAVLLVAASALLSLLCTRGGRRPRPLTLDS